ncbi:MAG: hypothetical protein ACK5IC_07565 [Moheibacter sp.]
MKKALFFITLFGIGFCLNAQDITAATGLNKGKIDFQDFRQLDLDNLSTEKILLSKTDNITFTSTTTTATTTTTTTQNNCSCGKYIAAMTVSTGGDLFYIPMTKARFSVVNPTAKSGNFYSIENSLVDTKSQGTYYARMTTGSDGYMYALNNAGTELLKISSNGSIQNLGAVNGILSKVTEFESEVFVYGGDMIADAFGDLYVISAKGLVFKIELAKMNANYLGEIKNLPQGYTVNGAAVTQDGKILLGTTSSNGFYTMDINTLEATFKADYNLPIYDLASPYFLRQDELNSIVTSNYSLYPTVVKTKELNIISKANQKEVLAISIWNINNKQVYSNTLNVKSVGDYKINLKGTLQPGIYVLKATNQNGNEVINTKFTLVQ